MGTRLAFLLRYGMYTLLWIEYESRGTSYFVKANELHALTRFGLGQVGLGVSIEIQKLPSGLTLRVLNIVWSRWQPRTDIFLGLTTDTIERPEQCFNIMFSMDESRTTQCRTASFPSSRFRDNLLTQIRPRARQSHA